MKSSPLMHLAVIAIAVVAALVVWGVARIADIELALKERAPSDEVAVSDVIVSTVVAGLVAWGLYAVLARNGKTRWWPPIASMLLAISMIGPSYLADGSSAMMLIAMHFAVGIVLIAGFALINAPNRAERASRGVYDNRPSTQ